MKSDHQPIHSSFQLTLHADGEGERCYRSSVPRKHTDDPKRRAAYEPCRDALADRIRDLPSEVADTGDLGRLIDEISGCLANHATQPGPGSRGAATGEILNLRGWALVSEELDRELLREGGRERVAYRDYSLSLSSSP